MSDAIEAAAKVIDPLAFQPAGSCNPRGYEAHSQEALSRSIAARRSHAIRVAERVVAAYRDSEIEALRAQVATLQDEQRLLDGVVRVLGVYVAARVDGRTIWSVAPRAGGVA